MDQNDPALNFFPDGEVDLYGALQLDSSAGSEAIKKAYKKLALLHHPDKSKDASSHGRFQQIGFAYAVLSDSSRKKRYDATGKTDELRFALGEDGEGMDWDEYFTTLWDGEVTGNKLREFKEGYQGSEEEKQDILEAYRSKKGDLQDILNEVPCLEILADEQRVVDLINSSIQSGELDSTKAWKRWTSNDKGRKRMRESAKKEAGEAEQAARELGVWDELFGNGKRGERRKGRGNKGEAKGDGKGHEDDHEEEDENENGADDDSKKRKRSNGASASAKTKKQKGRKGKAAKEEEEEEEEEEQDDERDTSSLEALFAARQKQRSAGFDDVISRIEARASGSNTGASGSKRGVKKDASAASKKKKSVDAKGSRRGAQTLPDDPLDDAEFERLQAALFTDQDKQKRGSTKKT
ncbi:DnaJ-domain-containing protein [Ceraceosorus guamensis]|uniref:DnaJ-domain-containing protein n=1 Tax=Ceraceosorus guamensis TaxID=1522189 RepID=A0A316W5Z4_9BASI|nr:DnaJ-domain-containing protein [Ceraceosorus guamensis]PWN43453.1 DnaJ-domain-containing protein [Ceraceosorus guamensis]